MPDSILASLAVQIGAEISGFDRGVATVKKELAGLVKAGERMQSIGQSLSLYVTAPLTLAGAAALKVGGDFQAAFNRVEAATGAAGNELASLKAKAQGIALDPNLQFSSVQAGQALEALAKNGLDTAQILGGAADASTALATATGGTLATAADITTDVMNNFGKSAEQAAGLVSNITGTTIASKFSIDDYRLALGQAGAVASQLGASFEDFNTALGVTSSGFSSGSDAGTSFKTFLQRLVPQSKEAEAAIKQLGLNFFDAQGKMRPLRDIAGQLQAAFKGLSDEQKNALGTKIFGADSIRTALLLAKEGVEGFDKMAESIGKVNAATQGAVLNQGFVGASEAFKSSVEGLGQAIADSGILDFATSLAQAGARLAASLAQADPVLLNTGVIIAGVAASIGPLSYAIGTVLANLGPLKVGFQALTSAAAGLVSPVGLAVVGVAALAAGLVYLAGSSERAVSAFQDQAKATQSLTSTVNPLLERYEELKSKTTLTAAEQEELRGIVERIAQQLPAAVSAFDAYGKAMDISAGKTRELIAAQQELEKQQALAILPDAEKRLQSLGQGLKYLQSQIADFNKKGFIEVQDNSNDESGNVYVTKALAGSKAVQELQLRVAAANVAFQKQQAVVDQLRGSAGLLAETIAGLEGGNLAGSLAEDSNGLITMATLSEEAAKALAKLQEELRVNGQLSILLGNQYDFIGERQKILEGGVKDLIKAGWDPSAKAVRDYAAELLSLNKILGDNSQLQPKTQKLLDPFSDEANLDTANGRNPLNRPTRLAPIDNSEYLASLQATAAAAAQFNIDYGQSVQTAIQLNEQIGSVISKGLQDLAVGIGQSLGAALAGTENLGDALAKTLLKTVGTVATQLGELAISIGVGILAIQIGLESLNPYVAIAAGIALVALGAYASSAVSGLGSSSAVPSGSGSFSTPKTSGNVPEQRIKIELEPVTFRQKGPDLDAVVGVTKYRRQRLS